MNKQRLVGRRTNRCIEECLKIERQREQLPCGEKHNRPKAGLKNKPRKTCNHKNNVKPHCLQSTTSKGKQTYEEPDHMTCLH